MPDDNDEEDACKYLKHFASITRSARPPTPPRRSGPPGGPDYESGEGGLPVSYPRWSRAVSLTSEVDLQRLLPKSDRIANRAHGYHSMYEPGPHSERSIREKDQARCYLYQPCLQSEWPITFRQPEPAKQQHSPSTSQDHECGQGHPLSKPHCESCQDFSEDSIPVEVRVSDKVKDGDLVSVETACVDSVPMEEKVSAKVKDGDLVSEDTTCVDSVPMEEKVSAKVKNDDLVSVDTMCVDSLPVEVKDKDDDLVSEETTCPESITEKHGIHCPDSLELTSSASVDVSDSNKSINVFDEGNLESEVDPVSVSSVVKVRKKRRRSASSRSTSLRSSSLERQQALVGSQDDHQ